MRYSWKTALDGVIGVMSATVGIVTSTQDHLLWGVQFLAASAGALVASVAAYKIIRRG